MKVSTCGAEQRRRKCIQAAEYRVRCLASCTKGHSVGAIFPVLLTLFTLVGSQQREGEWCFNEKVNNGICRPLRHCPYLMSKTEVFNGGIGMAPYLCIPGSSIVCCPTDTPETSSGSSTRKPPPPTAAQTPRPPTTRPPTTPSPTTRPPTTAPPPPPRLATTPSRPSPGGAAIGLRMSEKMCHEYMNSLDQETTQLRSSVGESEVWCPYPPPGNELIVGGTSANSGEYPHMAALGYLRRGKVEWLCGGSLISPFYVLTAAHCLQRNQGSLLAVSLRSLRVSSMALSTVKRLMEGAGETSHIYPVAESLRHPEYSKYAHYDDIALIRLAVPVRKFDLYVRPACLNADTNIAGIEKAVACGFGHTEFQDEASTRLLKQVTLSVYGPQVCSQVFSAVIRTSKLSEGIRETQVCAGHLEGGKDTCNGDSGGPLQMSDKDDKCITRIIGVTSFGTALCGLKNTAALYTSVAHYLPWIERVVWATP